MTTPTYRRLMLAGAVVCILAVIAMLFGCAWMDDHAMGWAVAPMAIPVTICGLLSALFASAAHTPGQSIRDWGRPQ